MKIGRENRGVFLFPCKGQIKPHELLHYSVKASDDLKKGNCILLPLISGNFLPIALRKKD
jgi:hypothetical protein